MKTADYNFHILAVVSFPQDIEGRTDPMDMIDIDLDTLDEAINRISHTISIPVPKGLCSAEYLFFKPSGIKDFRPHNLVKIIPYLKDVSDALDFIDDSLKKGLTDDQIAGQILRRWPKLPLDLSSHTKQTVKVEQKEKSAVDNLLKMVAMPEDQEQHIYKGRGAEVWRSQTEMILSRLLEQVFAYNDFRHMESTWKGVETILKQGNIRHGGPVKLSICSCSSDSLATILDQLKSLLSNEIPNLIILDYLIDNSAPSIELLKRILDFAGDILVPTMLWIDHRFFYLNNWSELKRLPYIKHHLEDMAYAKWRKLRDNAGSDWVVITCNRFMGRPPYGNDNPPRPVFFRENEPLWISPVWGMGSLIAKSMNIYGWPTRFTDYPKIAIEDLEVAEVHEGGITCTEAVFNEDRIMQLVEVGIIPITGVMMKDMAIAPKEGTFSGGSLRFQLFFNRIIGFIFRLKQEIGNNAKDSNLPQMVKSALIGLFKDTGHSPPQDLSVQIATPQKESNELPLVIEFTPPASIIPISERLKFFLS